MARTQFTLGQVTGSFSSIKDEVAQYLTPTTAGALTGSDLQDIVGALASAVQRIHGKASNEVFNQVEGTFDTAIFDVNTSGAVTLDGVGASNITTVGALTVSGSAGLNLKADSGTLDIETRTGAIDVDAGTTLSLDGAGGINIGTQTDVAIDIDSTTLDIDASGAITIDSDSTIGIGTAADDQTISIGTDGARTIAIGNEGAGNTTAINIKALGADGSDVSIESAAGSVNITGGESAADSVKITGSGVQVLSSDTSNGLKLATATSGVPITIGHSTSETTIADNLNVTGDTVLAGDLIVQGATTTVSSSNLIVQDSIIGLGVSGSADTGNNFNNIGDRAIIFARGANDFSALPALNFDGSEFELGTFLASPISQSMGNHVAGLPLRTGHLKPIADDGAALGDTDERWSDLFLAEGAVINFDNGDFTMTQTNNLLALAGGNTRVEKLEIDSANDHIDVNPSLGMAITSQQSLTASVGANFLLDAAGDILLDADGGDIEFLDGGTSLLKITNSSTDVVLQPQASNKDIIFKEDGGNEIARFDSSEESLLFPANKEIQFVGGSGKIFGEVDGEIVIDGGVKVEVTGSLVALYSETKGDNIRIRAGNVDTGVDIDAGNTASGSFNAGFIQITGSQRTDIGSAAGLNLGGQTSLGLTTGGRILMTAAQDDVDAVLIDASIGSGGGIQLKGGDQNDSIEIIQSPILFNNIAHPTAAVRKLYSVNNQLYHDSFVLLSGSAGSRVKATTTVTASAIPANTAIEVKGQGNSVGTFDFGGPSNNSLVDVFVNGQLMVSSALTPGNGDYSGGGSSNATIKFEFALERDDIISFVKSPI